MKSIQYFGAEFWHKLLGWRLRRLYSHLLEAVQRDGDSGHWCFWSISFHVYLKHLEKLTAATKPFESEPGSMLQVFEPLPH